MVSIVAIGYNNKRFFPAFFESVSKLTGAEYELLYIDNASADDSVEYIRQNNPNVRIIVNDDNRGYSGAADQGVKETTGEYVMIVNPDIVFEPDYLSILVRKLEEDKKIGAIIGKLRRYDFEKNEKMRVIDSAGLVMHRNRRCVDRGQAEEDKGQYDTAEEVFGITGACPLYRRSALDEAKIGENYFEPDFFMYKEDIDISWRLRLMGWSCWYEPSAVAYHGRGTGIFDRAGSLQVAKFRSKLPRFTKHHSYRNERIMRLRNEFFSMVIRDSLPILSREVLMFGWMMIREPYLFKSFAQVMARLPETLRKRSELMARRKIGPDEIRRWFV
ncbi:hypothetical protein CO046_05635 [Candidatus Peregrinibacteria bacterium CG_4_9_14_0_2_um_filter_53_11]|nr:MAG: hypothetical protein CO046_05635 [Candidatus Peregrinibacteria bacterium CG_4_9_14_0_2_um_filter_53_11]